MASYLEGGEKHTHTHRPREESRDLLTPRPPRVRYCPYTGLLKPAYCKTRMRDGRLKKYTQAQQSKSTAASGLEQVSITKSRAGSKYNLRRDPQSGLAGIPKLDPLKPLFRWRPLLIYPCCTHTKPGIMYPR